MITKSVAFFVDSFPKYSEPFIVNQIVGLIDLGFEVKIFSRKHNRNIIPTEDILKYELLDKHKCYIEDIHIPDNKLERIKQAFCIYRNNPKIRKPIIELINPLKHGRRGLSLRHVFQLGYFSDCMDPFDVIHAHYGPNGKEVLKLQKIGLFNARKTVVTFHGYDLHDYESKFYEDLFKSNYTYTVNSQYSKTKLEQLGATSKITIIPMGLSDVYLKDIEISKTEKKITILTVARLVPVKGIEYGIRAIKIIIGQGYEVNYWIIGEGELKNELQKLINKEDLDHHILLLGAKTEEEVYETYKSTDIFMLPGISTNGGVQEAQGLVIQEAQAMEIPVLVTDAGGMKEGMIDNETGYVVPQKNPEAIANKLVRLIEDESLRERFGKKGRDFVKENYDNRRLIKRLVSEVYES
ncbi:MAG: hypothetical protein C0591_14085 [Marinilabiliales bacterium]|nr:MAG: hypothetical protein C0591_14085 [Marinilabiliales bacterium]